MIWIQTNIYIYIIYLSIGPSWSTLDSPFQFEDLNIWLFNALRNYITTTWRFRKNECQRKPEKKNVNQYCFHNLENHALETIYEQFFNIFSFKALLTYLKAYNVPVKNKICSPVQKKEASSVK